MEKKYQKRFLNLSKKLVDSFFYVHDASGIFTFVSESITNILGYSEEQFMKHYTEYLTNSEINTNVELYTQKALEGEIQESYEVELYHKDGSIVTLEVTEIPVLDSDQNVIEVEGVGKNITERVIARDKAIQYKQMSDESQRIAHIGTFEYNTSTKEVICSKEFLNIFSIDKIETITLETFFTKILEDFKKIIYNKIDESIDNLNMLFELEYPLVTDKYLKMKWISSSTKTGQVILTGNVQDITREYNYILTIKEQKNEIEHQANHDELTGLQNRTMLFNQLQTTINYANRYKRELAVLFLDLDGFKGVNDSCGHDIGYKVLVIVAKRLKEAIRSHDSVYRLGGDEFVIITYDIDSSVLKTSLGQTILDSFNEPISVDNHTFHLTCSIGVSLYPNDSKSPKDLLQNADVAMYKAKNRGKNRLEFFSSEMTTLAFERLLMISNMKNAIKNDEFTVYYQPQYNCSTQLIIGSEALVRWIHPDFGIVSPMDFIPLAEETGMIMEIGEIVLKKSCLQIVEWHSKGYDPGKVAVNLAGKQILDKELFSKIMAILKETDCKPEWLELEVTEGFIMDDETDISRTNLTKLRKVGITLSIDDFGTGYSSLSYLKKLPIHKLKIDQSFIRDLEDDKDSRAIVKTIIALSKGLDLSIIAEGIETQYQTDFLINEGCILGQGFLFSRPIPQLEFEKILINQKIKGEDWKTF